VRNFEAFVIGGDAEHFSVGANLMQLLLSAQEGEWTKSISPCGIPAHDGGDQVLPRPVVVAPYSFCLGGGAEIAIHGARRQAHAELYNGAGGNRRRIAAGRRRLPGNAAPDAGRGGGGSRSRRTESVELMGRCGGFLKLSPCQGIHLGGGGAPHGHAAAGRRHHHEPRAPAERREAVGPRIGRRRLFRPLPRSDIPAPGENLLASLKLGST